MIPENILKLMSSKDRKALGKMGITAEEAKNKYLIREELDHQKQLCAYLDQKGIMYMHARTDKRSTINKGHPDFAIYCGQKVLFIECKSSVGKLSKDQEEWFKKAEQNRLMTCVSRSLLQSIGAILLFLNED